MRISDCSSDVCSSDLIGAGEDEDGGKFSQGTAFRLRRCGLPLYGLLGKRQSEADFPMISVILNGEPRQVREGSIADLVASLGLDVTTEIGRASCRERVCQYV